MIMKKIIIVITILINFSLISCTNFELSLWKNYHLNKPQISFSHSTHHHFIIFNNRTHKEWKSHYHFAQELIFIQFTQKDEKLSIIANHSNIAIQGFHLTQQISLSKTLFSQNNFQILLYRNNTKVQQQIILTDKQSFTLSVNFDYFVFKAIDSNWGFNFENEKNSIILKSNDKLRNFMKIYNINESYFGLGERSLSDTISSICFEKFQGYDYIGFCNNNYEGKRHLPHYKIDIRYSFLIIARMFEQYSKTSFFLFEQIINLIQSKLFYADGHFVQIPQHINIIRTYIKQIQKKNNFLSQNQLKKFNLRIKAILNGLMNQMLLADVNTLEEEINYRENKKMHPTLIKMLSLKWKSNSLKNAVSSIYEESFTPDYFYNHPNQKIDSCVSKMAWLAAISIEYGFFIKRFGNKDDLSAIEQPKSLFNILNSVANNDNHAKLGKFYSINTAAQGARVYALHIGYQSLLPYIYEISSVYPYEVMKNLTTSYGLASLNLDHQKVSQKFEFRGNIHLYFNYKILSQFKKKLQYQRKGTSDIVQIISNVRKTIMRNWNLGKLFTIWTSQGQGVRNRGDLSLLNLLIMSQNLS